MNSELTQAIADVSRYRSELYKVIIRTAAAEAVTKFGGRSRVLNLLVEEQLAVRERGTKFDVVVIDKSSGIERPEVSISDLLTEMRSSDEFARAFDTRPTGPVKLANNPWHPETKNITQQALLLQRNPAMAARMQHEAGVS